VGQVDEVVEYYETKSRMKHHLVGTDQYIVSPKPSGYRGVHLVYKYVSDKDQAWNGLRIELTSFRTATRVGDGR
jgi:ppGpp synthetase/RelA/SpoT-type nucleotidyltranferase